jgi:peptidyl-prolyl cis-trans isomerase D
MLDVIRRKSRSLGVKIIFGLIIIVFVFWGASGVNTNSPTTLARVNGVPINAADFDFEFQRMLGKLSANQSISALTDEQREALGQMQLEQMILQELIRQEAEKLGLGLSDIELSIIVNQTPDFHGPDGKFDPEVYKNTLARSRMTRGMFERRISNEIMTGRLEGYVIAAVDLTPEAARQGFDFQFERRSVDYLMFPLEEYAAKVTPKEAEIAEYYEGNNDMFAVAAQGDADYLIFTPESLAPGLSFSEQELRDYYDARLNDFEIPARYQARRILIAVPAGADEARLAAAKEKAEQALAELGSGKSFTTVAKSYSDDTHTKDNGGRLDWLNIGQADPDFEAEIQALKPGEISPVVRTALGFEIARLEEFVPASHRPFAAVQDEVLALKREDEAYRGLDDIMREMEDALVAKKPAFAELGAKYGLSPAKTGLLDLDVLAGRMGLNVAALSGLGNVQAGETLPVPVEVPGGFMLIKVNVFLPSHVQPLDAVKEEIADILRERDALALAMQAADEAAQEISADGGLPTKYQDRLQHSALVDRFTGLAALGFSPILTQSVFAATPGEWEKHAYSTETGAVLIQVATVVAPGESEWQQTGDMFTAQLLNNRKRQYFNAYVSQLYRNAEVEKLVDKLFRPRAAS